MPIPIPARSLAPLSALLVLLAAAPGGAAAQEAASALNADAATLPAQPSAALSGAQTGPVFPARRRFQHRQRIRAEYDRFTDSTTVSSEFFDRGLLGEMPFSVAPTVRFAFRGRVLQAPPESVTMLFTTDHVFRLSVEQRPGLPAGYAPRPVRVLVDDSLRFHDAQPVYRALVPVSSDPEERVNAMETVEATFPLAAFLAMAAGSRVEVSTAPGASFSLSESQREALRDLASRMNPAAWPLDRERR